MIVVPHIALDLVSVRLRRLTSLLVELGNESHCGALGGPDGYGVEFSNDVFTMRPFYWGDCDCGHEAEADAWWDKHPHTADCYQSDIGRETVLSDKDRMPERPNCYAECVDVLVWDADDEATQVAAWDGVEWFCDCYGHIERCKRITHWQPLPDPPEATE